MKSVEATATQHAIWFGLLQLNDFLKSLLQFSGCDEIGGNLIVEKVTRHYGSEFSIGAGAASFVNDAELCSHLGIGASRVY